MTGFPRSPDDLSEVFYNGFKFPPALSTTIRSTPVYDDSERQVIYVRHTIAVEFMLHNGVDQPFASATYTPVFPATNWEDNSSVLTDESLLAFRKLITTPGGHLVVNNIGFGGTRINTQYPVTRDVVFGPKPRLVEWDNQAAGRAIKVRWECEVSIAEEPCSPNIGQELLVHNATQTWDITQSGVTRRTTTGYLVIRANTATPLTVVNTTTNTLTSEVQDTGSNRTTPRTPQVAVLRTADAFRSRINYPPLEGFHREQNYSLSTDKTRLDYVIRDTEIESQNPYYPGTVSIQGNQRTAIDNLSAGVNWLTTISANVKVLPERGFYWAWIAFARIVESRLRTMDQKAKLWSVNRGKFANRKGSSNDGIKPAIFARRFTFDEQLFEPSFRFSVTFQVACDRNFIFQAMGAGDKVYGTNLSWSQWLREMRQAHDIRGLKGLMFDTKTDILFGLCDTGQESRETLQLRQPTSPAIPESEKKIKPETITSPSNTEQNDESRSWLDYRSRSKIIEKTTRIPHYKLEPNEYPSENNQYPAPRSPDDRGRQKGYTNSSQSPQVGSSPIIQARTTTKWLVEVTGTAERVGFGIGQPVMLTYAGVAAYPVGDLEFMTTERRDPVNNNTITKAVWRQIYQLASRPNGEPPETDTSSVNWT